MQYVRDAGKTSFVTISGRAVDFDRKTDSRISQSGVGWRPVPKDCKGDGSGIAGRERG